MSNPKKISKESAQEQFNQWLNYYGLDFEDIEITDGEEAAKTMMNTIVRAIQRGELSIDSTEKGVVLTQKLVYPTEKISEIVYADRVGKAKKAQRSAGKNGDAMGTFMSALTDIPEIEFMNLRGSDITIFDRISIVFSMV